MLTGKHSRATASDNVTEGAATHPGGVGPGATAPRSGGRSGARDKQVYCWPGARSCGVPAGLVGHADAPRGLPSSRPSCPKYEKPVEPSFAQWAALATPPVPRTVPTAMAIVTIPYASDFFTVISSCLGGNNDVKHSQKDVVRMAILSDSPKRGTKTFEAMLRNPRLPCPGRPFAARMSRQPDLA